MRTLQDDGILAVGLGPRHETPQTARRLHQLGGDARLGAEPGQGACHHLVAVRVLGDHPKQVAQTRFEARHRHAVRPHGQGMGNRRFRRGQEVIYRAVNDTAAGVLQIHTV